MAEGNGLGLYFGDALSPGTPFSAGAEQLRALTGLIRLLCEAYDEVRELMSDEPLPLQQLRGGTGEERPAILDEALTLITGRSEAARAAGRRLPFSLLRESFGLNDFELFCVLLALCPDADPAFETIFAELQDDERRTRASLQLAGELYGFIAPVTDADLYRMLDRRRPVNGLLLSEWANTPDRSQLRRPLAAPKQLLYELLDVTDYGVDDIGENGRLLTAGDEAVLWNESKITSGVRFVGRALHTEGGRPWVLYLHGAAGTGKSFALSRIGQETGVRWYCLDAKALEGLGGEDERRLLRQTALHCRLLGAAPCLDRISPDEAHFPQIERVTRYFKGLFPLIALCADRAWCFTHDLDVRHLALEFKRPEEGERRALWEHYAAETGLGLTAEEVRRLAGQYRLSAADIVNLCDTLSIGVYEGEDVYARVAAALREQAEARLGKLACRLPAVFTWDMLELPDDAKETLRSACERIHNSYQIHESWGFGKRLPYGRGVSVLMYGPPGTGKTMAAQVLAGEVGLDVFRVDLSQIVDKYIGETEKNLGRLFDTAQDVNCILFFDEADALFSKRTEVGDSKDKYANIETAYLLQRIEQFSGVTILATNNARNFDEAFRRRMSYFVNIPMPDEATRLRIWQKVFPPELPLAPGVRFEELARAFELSGSSIKSIAVSAAYAAAAAGTEVTRRSIYEALKIEFSKTGRLFSEVQYHW